MADLERATALCMDVIIYFNNDFGGFAPQNARELSDMPDLTI